MTEAHVRIDEGVKRGPRKKRTGPRLAPLKTTEGREYHPGKLQGVEPLGIITRYLNGETSEQIALTLNCTRQGLAYYLRKTAEEDWREAQIVQAIERKDSAEDELRVATDALSLARAREQLRAAQWDLERLFSRLYGQKQELTIKAEINLVSVLDGHCERLLDKIGDAQRHIAPLSPQVIDVEPVSDSGADK